MNDNTKKLSVEVKEEALGENVKKQKLNKKKTKWETKGGERRKAEL